MSWAAWAAWAALALVLILWVTVLVTVVLVARFWRKVEPTVTPMLSMFAGPLPAGAGDVLEAAGEHDNGAL